MPEPQFVSVRQMATRTLFTVMEDKMLRLQISSTTTADAALASEDDSEHPHLFRLDYCMPYHPESEETVVEPSQANSDHSDSDVFSHKIAQEEQVGEASKTQKVSKSGQGLKAFERVLGGWGRPEQRNMGEYLAKQRKACKEMLMEEIKARQAQGRRKRLAKYTRALLAIQGRTPSAPSRPSRNPWWKVC
ncbi:hypothetical protein ACHAP5_011069 [Fusarium lateritium]